ncbi:MAG: FAD-binding oxidoreductase [Bilophila wadsworthia]
MPSASLIKEFEQLVGKENVFSSEADRQSYAYDAAVLKPMIPSLVVRPTEVEQLGQVVKRCYEEGIPMTVRGSGTNLTGGTIPDCSDTIVILTTGLNKILEINTEDLYATVQPGVITAKFAAAVAKACSILGSMSCPPSAATSRKAQAACAASSGTTKDYVMGGSLRQHR